MDQIALSRRDWLKAAGTVAAVHALRSLSPAGQPGIGPDRPYLLSEQGCGRATGYAESNKIVTRGDRVHVAWLDSPQGGFRVRARTLNRRTGEWSRTYTVGEAYDNHGGPALTCDSRGFLHIVYYPHHHAMRYRRSQRPNDASEWEDEVQIGERLTYPTLLCARDDALFLTCRRSFSGKPWQVELWKRRPGEAWRRQGAILESRHPGYAHFQESLAWAPDHRTLHLCCRFHEKTDAKGYGRRQTVAYLISRDAGKTWRRSDGRAVSLPATAESAEVLASGGVDHGRILRAGAMAVDPAGRPHVLYSVEEDAEGKLLIATPASDGNWQRIDLAGSLPEERSSWKLVAPGGITFNGRGEMIVAAMMQKPGAGEPTWGHPSNEVVAFRCPVGGKKYSFAVVGRSDHAESHWLPNIERTTGHHQVPADPGILYTAGGPGEKNTDLLSNKVFFAKIRS